MLCVHRPVDLASDAAAVVVLGTYWLALHAPLWRPLLGPSAEAAQTARELASTPRALRATVAAWPGLWTALAALWTALAARPDPVASAALLDLPEVRAIQGWTPLAPLAHALTDPPGQLLPASALAVRVLPKPRQRAASVMNGPTPIGATAPPPAPLTDPMPGSPYVPRDGCARVMWRVHLRVRLAPSCQPHRSPTMALAMRASGASS